eukprot:CAMPEP_0182484848 /NCGR_PEP_ID=MMETSP1319-20130603/44158_1 /TAXON_ID=172717 /ORGANISM="Bolidomonas pacifica, Strain RCC208" /LENGTH=53 /DNA_ID=CAMNT_0024686773 /DNA_START=618 /DNA_END=779 /DNA_ORIENTATION=+
MAKAAREADAGGNGAGGRKKRNGLGLLPDLDSVEREAEDCAGDSAYSPDDPSA